MHIRTPSFLYKRNDEEWRSFAIPSQATYKNSPEENKREANLFQKRKNRLSSVSAELGYKELKLFFEALCDLKEISLTQCHVMLKLLKIWSYKGLFPKYEEIAKQASVSLSTAKRVLKDMRLSGYISWTNKWVGSKQSSNRYFFTVTKKFFQKIIEKIKAPFKVKAEEKSPKSHRVSKRPSIYNYNKYNYNNTEASKQKNTENSPELRKLLDRFWRQKTEKTYPKERKERRVSLMKKLKRLLNEDIQKGTKFLQRFGSPNHHHYLDDLEKIEQALDRLLSPLNPRKSQSPIEFRGRGVF